MNNKTLFDEFQKYVSENILNSLTAEHCEKFEIYFNRLIEWNNKFNLISFKSGEDLIYRHFCDSLYSAKIISEGKEFTKYLKIADVGTGAGMPGIPVKIVLPQAALTLIESVTKKCVFLENMNNELNLNCEILNDRAETIGRKQLYRQSFDFVLSRAVSKFSPNLEIAVPLLKVGGYFITYKTKNSIEDEKEGLPSIKNALKCLGVELEKDIYYNLPDNERDYCILVFKKIKDTPEQFPRKAGAPEKKPL
jgi:16S rRNA (guanine527-N7)-methyltransferase